MFEDDTFAIDKESDQYKLMHPTQNGKQQRQQADEDSRSDRGGDSDSEVVVLMNLNQLWFSMKKKRVLNQRGFQETFNEFEINQVLLLVKLKASV